MPRFYLDTSALVKLYHQEDGTEIVDNLLLQDQVVIVTSSLSLIETVSAFARRVRSQEITRETFDLVITAFEQDTTVFDLIPIDQGVEFNAMQLLKTWGVEQGLRTLDALQLSSALVAHRKMPLDLFVAADKTLLAVASQELLPVLLT